VTGTHFLCKLSSAVIDRCGRAGPHATKAHPTRLLRRNVGGHALAWWPSRQVDQRRLGDWGHTHATSSQAAQPRCGPAPPRQAERGLADETNQRCRRGFPFGLVSVWSHWGRPKSVMIDWCG